MFIVPQLVGPYSLQHGDARRPKEFAIHEVAASMFGIYRSGLFSVAINHGHRLVYCWIERLALTVKRCDAIRMQHVAESLTNQPETVGYCIRCFAYMQQGAVEVVHHVEKREKHFAFSVLFRKGLFLPRAPSVVIKFSQQSKTAFALGIQFLLQPNDLGIQLPVRSPSMTS